MASYTQWIPVTGETGYPELISAFITQLETDVTTLENTMPTKMPKLSSGTVGDIVKIDTVSGIESAGIASTDVIFKTATLVLNEIPVINHIQGIRSSGINFDDVAERDASWVTGNLVVVDSNEQLVDGGPPSAAGAPDSMISLTDTEVTVLATTKELMVWNGLGTSKWVNRTYGEAGLSETTHTHTIDSLTDTNIGTESIGEVLMWDGNDWIDRTLAQANIRAADSITTIAHGGTGRGTSIMLGAVLTGNNTSELIGVNSSAIGQLFISDGAGSTPSYMVSQGSFGDILMSNGNNIVPSYTNIFYNGDANFGTWTTSSNPNDVTINTGFGSDNFSWGIGPYNDTRTTFIALDNSGFYNTHSGSAGDALSLPTGPAVVGSIKIRARNFTNGGNNVILKVWARRNV